MNAKIIKKTIEAKNTYSFFIKPEKKMHFLPGQFIYVTLPDLKYDDKRGSTRHFTIASSPTKKEIMFTTRIRKESGYKRSLIEYKIGDIVEINGPNGTFIVDENEEGQHVFVAGGIGITPFISILEYKIAKKLKYKVTLIYSNSDKKSLAFEKNLLEMVKKDNTINLFLTLTREKSSSWKGLSGRIDKDMLSDILLANDISTSHFWISGSSDMVRSTEKIVEDMGVNPDNIRLDKFTGY